MDKVTTCQYGDTTFVVKEKYSATGSTLDMALENCMLKMFQRNQKDCVIAGQPHPMV